MSHSISYSKYPGEQNTYNGGNFFSNNNVATAGCSGTTCNVLAANSVFESSSPQSTALSGGKRRRTYKKRAMKKRKSKKHAKKSKTMRKNKKSTRKHKSRSHRGRSRKYKMRGGSKGQLMSNICHSTGYSIGDTSTTLSPKEVGLAIGHFAPYTKTQNN